MSENTDRIDPRNNPESQVAEGGASQVGTRSSTGGGAPPTEPRPAGAVPGVPGPGEDPESGTAAGNPLDGLLIDPEDAKNAVPGDEGPEHPGRR